MATPGTQDYRVVPVFPDDLPVVYSNFVMVTKSPNEYLLNFCYVALTGAPEKGPSGEQPTIPAVAKVQLVLPPGVAEGLLNALEKQKNIPFAEKPKA